MNAPTSNSNRIVNAVLLAAASGVALTNGLHSSPLFDSVLFFLRPAVPSILVEPSVLFYFTSVFIVVMTLLVAGIPAAIYERVRGHILSTPVSLGLWLVTTTVLALPGLLGVIGYFDIE